MPPSLIGDPLVVVADPAAAAASVLELPEPVVPHFDLKFGSEMDMQ
jgi:hypothetical protein